MIETLGRDALPDMLLEIMCHQEIQWHLSSCQNQPPAITESFLIYPHPPHHHWPGFHFSLASLLRVAPLSVQSLGAPRHIMGLLPTPQQASPALGNPSLAPSGLAG